MLLFEQKLHMFDYNTLFDLIQNVQKKESFVKTTLFLYQMFLFYQKPIQKKCKKAFKNQTYRDKGKKPFHIIRWKLWKQYFCCQRCESNKNCDLCNNNTEKKNPKRKKGTCSEKVEQTKPENAIKFDGENCVDITKMEKPGKMRWCLPS